MMNKRLFSILLCLALMLSAAVPVCAENPEEQQEEVNLREIQISTTEEFLDFAEKCRLDSFSQNLVVSLEADIDLTNTSFSCAPVFSGVFRGNGYTISGISITGDGSYQGLFRYVTQEAIVQNLTVVGEVRPDGSRSAVGAIAGSNAGLIRRCKFQGTVSGGEYVGGIVGKNTVTGIVDSCMVEGDIYGDHFVGGIAGENCGVLRACTNEATVNVLPQQNSVAITDITMDTLMNSEAAGTTTDIGGVAGISSGVMKVCINRGDIGYKHMGYNIGGIVGTHSGYMTDSRNYGSVQGRKEIGGIVGQMEPVTQIEFSEDTLQILKGQLDTMSGLVSSASANAQGNASEITRNIAILQDQTQTAKDAISTLFPDQDSPQLPDPDTILAAQNTLSKTMESMPSTVRGIASAAQSTVSGISRDLNAISGQIGVMSQTISNASEYLGGSITDISDQDMPDMLTGKIENCMNYGSVLADLNVGGIAGAMAIENDLDVMADWEQSGDTSLNFQSDVRAVMLNCENSGVVTGKKQNVGGLVGWQSLGLVKEGVNTGKVDGTAAEYVGGVAGQSTGFLRAVSANCEIYGDSYVGGIAGSAMTVTDSLSHVKIMNGRERLGAILGWTEENQTTEEEPIHNNHYLCADEDYGAIDSISYAGLAEPLELSDFLAIDDLPDTFKNVKIRFLYEDGTMTEVLVPAGGELGAEKIPQIPAKTGYSASWNGIEQAQLTGIMFDMTFEAVYHAFTPTMESAETREDGHPILLLEGSFTDAATVTVEPSDVAPKLEKKQQLLESWVIHTNESGTTARLLMNAAVDPENLILYVSENDGQWMQTDFHVDGSYLVFEMTQKQAQIALVQQPQNYTLLVVAVGTVLVALSSAIVIIHKKKRAKEKAPCAE